jgi:hypothetical protein
MIISAENFSRENEMGNFGEAVLVIFIIIRILITAGALYLIISEVRKYRKRGRDKPGKTDV